MESASFTAHGGARQLRSFLRSCSTARSRKRASIERKHDRTHRLHFHHGKPFSGASRRATFSGDSAGPPVKRAGELHHDGAAYTKRLFRARKLRNREAARGEYCFERLVSACAGAASAD